MTEEQEVRAILEAMDEAVLGPRSLNEILQTVSRTYMKELVEQAFRPSPIWERLAKR